MSYLTHSARAGRVFLGLVALISGMPSAWAGTASGDTFVLRPWLSRAVYPAVQQADGRIGATVELYFQLENPSGTPVVLKDLELRWDVLQPAEEGEGSYDQSGKVRLNELGGPPFTGYGTSPHSVVTDGYCGVGGSNCPTVILKGVPRGHYSYSIALIDPTASNRVIYSASVRFEVK